jgi:5-aminopentanamidase
VLALDTCGLAVERVHNKGPANEPAMTPSEHLVVAAVQMAPVAGDISGNAATTARLIRSAAAQGAQLVVFPELSLLGYDLDLLAASEAWTTAADDRLHALREACTRTGTWAIVGTAFHNHDGRRFLASLAIGPDGSEVVQGKRHLHGAEQDRFDVGDTTAPLLDVAGWRIAMAVCFDAAVPAHAQAAADAGADVYAVSALYTTGQERRLEVHMAARTMDHGMHGVLANLAGAGPGWVSCGNSGTWHPDGTRSGRVHTAAGMLVSTLRKRNGREA